jgi:hypothetical protein
MQIFYAKFKSIEKMQKVQPKNTSTKVFIKVFGCWGILVRYHAEGSMKLNAHILLLAHMVYL